MTHPKNKRVTDASEEGRVVKIPVYLEVHVLRIRYNYSVNNMCVLNQEVFVVREEGGSSRQQLRSSTSGSVPMLNKSRKKVDSLGQV